MVLISFRLYKSPFRKRALHKDKEKHSNLKVKIHAYGIIFFLNKIHGRSNQKFLK